MKRNKLMKTRSPHWADRFSGKLFLGSVIPLAVIFAWWLGIRSGSAVVPTFGEVFQVLAHPFEVPPDIYSRSLAFSTMMTLIRLFTGFGLGVITAVPLGLLAGQSRAVDRLLQPAVQMARPINPIVLLPIATVLFGISSAASIIVGGDEAWKHDVWDQVQVAMIIILWWGAFFPIFISTVHGVRAVRTAYIETMELMGASRTQIFLKVLYPHSLPYTANGMRIAMGVTWLVLIAAEIFPGTRSGLGYMLCVACKTSDYQYTFAAILVIGVVAYLTDLGLHRLERSAGHWQAAER
jgi:NitT/TauT family transport system permease protein